MLLKSPSERTTFPKYHSYAISPAPRWTMLTSAPLRVCRPMRCAVRLRGKPRGRSRYKNWALVPCFPGFNSSRLLKRLKCHQNSKHLNPFDMVVFAMLVR